MKEIGPASPPRDPPGDERTLRLEIALRRSEKLAMAGRVAASVMHEINNPSQAIADLVYLIAKEADRPELVRAFLQIDQHDIECLGQLLKLIAGVDIRANVQVSLGNLLRGLLKNAHGLKNQPRCNQIKTDDRQGAGKEPGREQEHPV